MIRESNVSDRTPAGAVAAALVVILVSATMPSANAPIQAADASRMPAPDSRASEGNVVDLTY